MSQGYLKIHRSFFEHFLWTEGRPFSRAEAWLDLIQSAAYTSGSRLIQGQPIAVPRGALVASVRWLCERWRWSNSKVCHFLKMLREQGMIALHREHNITVLTLCNYEAFNFAAPPKEESDSPPPARSRRKPVKTDSSSKSTTPPADGRSRADSPEQVIAYCARLGLPATDGLYLWESWQAGGWTRGGQPIRDWQAQVRAWKTGGYLPSQKAAARRLPATSALGPITATHDPTGATAAQYQPATA